MTSVEPQHCRLAAFELMADHARHLSPTDGLLGGAVAIAMHEMPETSVDSVRSRIDELAAQIRCRFESDSPHAILAHAHHVLFDELGFMGVIGDHEPLDSYLPAVLDRRRGLPIVLALIYKLVLERLGVPVHGLNTPGRFLAGVELGDSVMFVDPSTRGRVLSTRELIEFIQQQTGATALDGKRPLPIASHREWLQRMLRNLMGVFGTRNRPAEFAAMVELKSLLDDV